MNYATYFHDGVCEVWASKQSPQDSQRAVARKVGLNQYKVTVNVPLIGGGFGRCLETDYAVEVAQVSKAINAPVQVVWTRADDLQHDFYQLLTVLYFKHPSTSATSSARAWRAARSSRPGPGARWIISWRFLRRSRSSMRPALALKCDLPIMENNGAKSGLSISKSWIPKRSYLTPMARSA